MRIYLGGEPCGQFIITFGCGTIVAEDIHAEILKMTACRSDIGHYTFPCIIHSTTKQAHTIEISCHIIGCHPCGNAFVPTRPLGCIETLYPSAELDLGGSKTRSKGRQPVTVHEMRLEPERVDAFLMHHPLQELKCSLIEFHR